MSLASEERSKLNPNAPLFIPAAYQVEDFSPQWWQLVTTSTWYHDYWLSQHQEESDFSLNSEDDYDIAEFLPLALDLEGNEELRTMEAEFEEFIQASLNEGTQELP
ncbi:protein EARLY RESPONSIVE TO DEHYDRATION 15-like [Cucurbita maxima]|uniref:Protein EARLY RESPONSIVE TO DEHYDRATION 15-like n=1 Tax=Cucurbita maxima TaxID=3661 RepID=A0A6J1HTZ3_CUCMA|nr:protein EARLY RESPONSIVE TO DEHYDRATION 15-like [Cucurbita maxima]